MRGAPRRADRAARDAQRSRCNRSTETGVGRSHGRRRLRLAPSAIGAGCAATRLHQHSCFVVAAQALLDALDASVAGKATPRPQPADGVTYAAKIRKEEAVIDWSRSAPDIDRQIRAFNAWPIAQTQWNGQQL